MPRQVAAIVALGYCLLLLQSSLLSAWVVHPYIPQLALPLVLYLAASSRVPLLVGTTTVFVLGYFSDTLCAASLGLHTFVSTAAFLVVRGLGLRVALRNPGWQALIVFVAAGIVDLSVLSLRAIFEPPEPFPHNDAATVAHAVFASALASAVCAPIVFALARLTDRSVRMGKVESA